MTIDQLKKKFPHASAAFIAANADKPEQPHVAGRKYLAADVGKSSAETGHRQTVSAGAPVVGSVVFAPTETHVIHELKQMLAETQIDRSFQIVIDGQIVGGKNNICITKTGHRFPNESWAQWRDHAVVSVVTQLPKGFRIISLPVNVRLDYFSGDKRRRDMPAIIDAIFHVLEKAGVVTDDTLIWISESTRVYDKENPRAIITFPAEVNYPTELGEQAFNPHA